MDMGLTITAYSKVTLVCAIGAREFDGNREAQSLAGYDSHTFLYQDGERPQSDGMADGVYSTDGKGFEFEAGSYGGYGAWRNELAEMMLGKSAEDVWTMCNAPATEAKSEAERMLPFLELINFSDCEGFIGPKTCAKLSADFANNQKKANGGDKHFRKRYAEWRKAFAIASEGGVVKFH